MFDTGIHQGSLPASETFLQPEDREWYAIHTKPRHEKWIYQQLQNKQVTAFLPLLRQIHRWSDRRTVVELPLFSCYAFVRIASSPEERIRVLRTAGVLGFVGSDRQGTPISESEIENLRIAVKDPGACSPHPFLSVGKRVRVIGGALNGVEGILVENAGDQSVVISIEILQRSVSIRVAGYDLELA